MDGGLIASIAFALISALFAWLNARDKQRFDAERVEQRAQIAALSLQVAVLTAQVADQKSESQRWQKRSETLEQQLRDEREQCDRRLNEMEGRLTDLVRGTPTKPSGVTSA